MSIQIHIAPVHFGNYPITFIIIPIFASTNAGVSLAIDFEHLFSTNVAIGVTLGLLLGKVVGVVGFTLLLVKLNIYQFPAGMNVRNLFGLGLLAAIGFTMPLFITSLAFTQEEFVSTKKRRPPINTGRNL